MTDRVEPLTRSTEGAPRNTRRGHLFALLRLAPIFAALFALLAPIALAPTDARAQGYAVGELIQPFQLYDQHDTLHEVDVKTRIILFSRDMKGGDFLKAALGDVSKGFLTERRAVYVSDISGMPRIIAKLFALPSMRRRPYSMLLDRDGTSTQLIPDVEGKATLVFLDALQVDRIEHVSSADEVTQLLSSQTAENADTASPAETSSPGSPSVSSAPSGVSPETPVE